VQTWPYYYAKVGIDIDITVMSTISDVRHRHLLFRYQKKICRTENCHSDIRIVPISTYKSFPICDIQNVCYTFAGFEPKTFNFAGERLTSRPLCWSASTWMSDIGYRIKVYSDIRFNVGLLSLQSDIGSSEMKLSPISLITDIGVSAHLCYYVVLPTTVQPLSSMSAATLTNIHPSSPRI
jgi:hypothetical protein